jgi:hypothetical protein
VSITPDAIADPLLDTVVGDVRIERVIGVGGMGRVYEGRQLRPGRQVAVKVMRPGTVSPERLRRFEFEAELLGNLRHPGIAAIHAAGTHPFHGESLPFFVMELVPDGRPITRHVEETALPLRRKLELFQDVCEAVAHGHQKGVIHRDLKPGNILVGSDGGPKVIDFGIARTTGTDLAVGELALTTTAAFADRFLGTLEYMSPEQFGTDEGDLDVRADVYALGVVLYELLAGRPPHDLRDTPLVQAITVVREREPPPLAVGTRGLAPALAAIVGKCLAKDRRRRYASAAELAADIGRHLAGEPVTARPPAAWESVVRFVRRHRLAAAVAASLLVAGLVAAAGITIFAVQAERARRQAVAERERADAEAAAARRSLAEAQAATAQAQASLRRSMDVVDAFTTTVAKRLESPPELHPLRDELLDAAVQHYRQFLDQNPDDQKLREELGWALTRLAETRKRSGDPAAAARPLRDRIDTLRDLVTREPANDEYRRDLARSIDELARLVAPTGETADARKLLDEAIAVKRRLVSSNPENLGYSRELARSVGELGLLALEAGDLTLAREQLGQWNELLRSLVASSPANPAYRRDLARSVDELGKLAKQSGDMAEARKWLAEANTLWRSIVAANPENPEPRRDLARSVGELGLLAKQSGDLAAARELLEEWNTLLQSLVASSPSNPGYRRDLARSVDELGKLVARAGSPAAAEELLADAIAAKRALVASSPASLEYRRDLARSLDELGKLRVRTGDAANARSPMQEANSLLQAIVAEQSANAGYRRDLARNHEELAKACFAEEDLPAAVSHFAAAAAVLRALVSDTPRHAGYRRDLAYTLGFWAAAERRADPEKAARLEAEAAELSSNPDQVRPEKPETGRSGEAREFAAEDSRLIRAAAGSVARVSGFVSSVTTRVGNNQLTFVNLSSERKGFTAVIHRTALPAFEKAFGADLESLQRRQIVVEGTISIFKETPQIVLNDPDQIRLLGEANPSGGSDQEDDVSAKARQAGQLDDSD